MKMTKKEIGELMKNFEPYELSRVGKVDILDREKCVLSTILDADRDVRGGVSSLIEICRQNDDTNRFERLGVVFAELTEIIREMCDEQSKRVSDCQSEVTDRDILIHTLKQIKDKRKN